MVSTVASPVSLTVTHPSVRLSDEAISAMARLVLGLANRPEVKLPNTSERRVSHTLLQARSAS